MVFITRTKVDSFLIMSSTPYSIRNRHVLYSVYSFKLFANSHPKYRHHDIRHIQLPHDLSTNLFDCSFLQIGQSPFPNPLSPPAHQSHFFPCSGTCVIFNLDSELLSSPNFSGLLKGKIKIKSKHPIPSCHLFSCYYTRQQLQQHQPPSFLAFLLPFFKPPHSRQPRSDVRRSPKVLSQRRERCHVLCPSMYVPASLLLFFWYL